MNKPTHKERVLALLSDKQPHSHHELYALHVIGHSRISDLRKDGYLIAQWRDGDDYLYQLVGGSSEAPGVSPEDGAAATSGGTAAPESATLGVSLDTTGQLTLAAPEFRKQQRAA